MFTFIVKTNVTPSYNKYHRCYVLEGITREVIENNGWVKTGETSCGYGYVRATRSPKLDKVGVVIKGSHKGELFILEHTNDTTEQRHFHYNKVYYRFEGNR